VKRLMGWIRRPFRRRLHTKATFKAAQLGAMADALERLDPKLSAEFRAMARQWEQIADGSRG